MSGRILALLGDSFHAAGGIAQYNRDLIGAWAGMDAIDEIVLVPRFASGSRSELPDKVVQETPTPRLYRYVFRAIATSIRRSPFDFVFCAHLNLLPLAAAVSRLLDVPVWLQLHGTEAWNKPGRMARWTAERSALVTSVSRHTRRMFLRWADVEPSIVRILPNTVGERFSVKGDRHSVNGLHELAGKKILLTVSRLSRGEGYKGHENVIRCLPKLCSEFDDLVYVIAGEGELREDLRELAVSLGVGHAVKFLGPVSHHELPSLYRGADVFVMPSTGEGFGIVYLEAIACGTPVIAGDRDGARDPLQDGALGTLASEGELLTAIREVLTRDSRSAQSGRVNACRAKSVNRLFGRETFTSTVSSITTGLAGIDCA